MSFRKREVLRPRKKKKFERNKLRKSARMQMNSQVAISGEGVLKNDEYDPYAVIVLNQL